jgi:hypothetical protein
LRLGSISPINRSPKRRGPVGLAGFFGGRISKVPEVLPGSLDSSDATVQ